MYTTFAFRFITGGFITVFAFLIFIVMIVSVVTVVILINKV